MANPDISRIFYLAGFIFLKLRLGSLHLSHGGHLDGTESDYWLLADAP